MRIAVDLDGVIAETHGAVVEEINQEEDSDHRLEDIRDYHMETTPFTFQKFKKVARKLWRNHEISLTSDKVPQHLERIGEKHHLDIVTARHDVEKKILEEWAEKQNLPHNSLIVDDKKTQRDYDLLIDDCPRYVGRGMNLLFYHRPYNDQVSLGELEKRIRNFEQVKKHVLESVDGKTV